MYVLTVCLFENLPEKVLPLTAKEPH